MPGSAIRSAIVQEGRSETDGPNVAPPNPGEMTNPEVAVRAGDQDSRRPDLWLTGAARESTRHRRSIRRDRGHQNHANRKRRSKQEP